MDKRSKSDKQDTRSEHSLKTDNRNLRAKLRRLEKENRHLKREFKKIEHRIGDANDILEEELESEFLDNPPTLPVLQIKKKCQLCDVDLVLFTIDTPIGPLHFEKCNICKSRKRIKTDA